MTKEPLVYVPDGRWVTIFQQKGLFVAHISAGGDKTVAFFSRGNDVAIFGFKTLRAQLMQGCGRRR